MKLPSLTHIIEAVVIFIAAGSFVISYNNLHESALEMGIPPILAIVFPFTIDGILMCATIFILYAGQKQISAWEGWAVLAGYTTASIAFNVHMAPEDIWSQTGFAMCPIGLCIMLHILMKVVETEMGVCEVTDEVKYEIELPPISPCSEFELSVTPESCDLSSVKIPTLTDNQIKVRDVFKEDEKISMAEACRRTGLSFKTVKGHKITLEEMGMI